MRVYDDLKGFFQIAFNSKDYRKRVDENIKHGLFYCVVSTLVVGANNKTVLGNHVQQENLNHVFIARDNKIDFERLVVVLFGITVVGCDLPQPPRPGDPRP